MTVPHAGSQRGLGRRAVPLPSCRLSTGCFPPAGASSASQQWAISAIAPRVRDDTNDTRPGWVHEMQRVTRKVTSQCLQVPLLWPRRPVLLSANHASNVIRLRCQEHSRGAELARWRNPDAEHGANRLRATSHKAKSLPWPQGLRALLSAPWYLNLGEFAAENWLPYYLVEPLDFNVRPGLRVCS